MLSSFVVFEKVVREGIVAEEKPVHVFSAADKQTAYQAATDFARSLANDCAAEEHVEPPSLCVSDIPPGFFVRPPNKLRYYKFFVMEVPHSRIVKPIVAHDHFDDYNLRCPECGRLKEHFFTDEFKTMDGHKCECGVTWSIQ